METVDRILGQEQIFVGQREPSGKIEELRRDVESLRNRLDRLAKMETLLEGKYRRKLEDLLD